MKKILIILTLCFFGLGGYCQNIKSQVDKRVELLSIIFRLAGNKEYNDNFAKTYVADIDKHFNKFKNDSLIQFARQLHENDGIGYEAVMTFAVCLIFQNNHFVFEKNFKSDLDKRWKEKDALKFLSLLNSFYIKSSFTEFFNDENEYYSIITTSLNNTLKTFNTSWFYKYFGKITEEQFNIVVGCGNGGGNYGVKNHNKEIFAIIGSETFNDSGFPIFRTQDCFPTIVHEFNHSFINPLLNNYEMNETFRKSTTVLLDSMKNEMENQAYGDWQTLVNESLVRASVVRYLIDNGAEEKVINAEIADQTG
ncbi:MAG: DUF4932 domain-containing protein [Bacteroidota bacterium]|nr:DUF4932 domain-containing protein [Bacteroidota bacterium]